MRKAQAAKLCSEMGRRPRHRDRHAAPYDLVILDAPASGHGLAMLRGLLRDHGGSLRVGAGEGGGTRVTASLPVA